MNLKKRQGNRRFLEAWGKAAVDLPRRASPFSSPGPAAAEHSRGGRWHGRRGSQWPGDVCVRRLDLGGREQQLFPALPHQVQLPWYGIDYPNSAATGRFTIGRTIGDYMGKCLPMLFNQVMRHNRVA
jgi:hypothetical protein